ncbi:hypothetical protein JXL19_09280 [bacterium]|nr:hypothetical protein [bacterium]
MCKVNEFEGKAYILKILTGLFLINFIIFFCGCIHQQPVQIETPEIPRVVIREIHADPNGKTEFDPNMKEASYLLPDLTKGYIKNEAYPLGIRVWWLNEAGQKEILIGTEGDNFTGQADFYFGNIREFNFPPGRQRLMVERWKFIWGYGWLKEGNSELLKIEVGRIPRGRWFSGAEIGHYNWAVIIGSEQSRVYEEGRVP